MKIKKEERKKEKSEGGREWFFFLLRRGKKKSYQWRKSFRMPSTPKFLMFLGISFLFMIFFSLLSITTIMFGEYLVNYFQLEHKFPKLSKYIQLRSKLSKTALIIYFIYIYLVVIIFIIIIKRFILFINLIIKIPLFFNSL